MTAAQAEPSLRLRRWFDDPGLRGLLAGMLRHLGPTGIGEVVGSRPYQPGDDPRGIDWSWWGRSGEIFVRQTRQEMDLDVELLLDAGAGMAIGRPESAWSRAIAFCEWLGTETAKARLRCHLVIGGSPVRVVRRGLRGRGIGGELKGAIAALRPEGTVDLPGSLVAAATTWRRRRMFVVVASELPDSNSFVPAVARVLRQGHAVRVVFVEGSSLVDDPRLGAAPTRLPTGERVDLRSLPRRWQFLAGKRQARARFLAAVRTLPRPAFDVVELGLDTWLPTEAVK